MNPVDLPDVAAKLAGFELKLIGQRERGQKRFFEFELEFAVFVMDGYIDVGAGERVDHGAEGRFYLV